MRVPRAYLAGFGTSGSLLAGAALLFVLASAFIGFDGWPQVADSPSTVAFGLPQGAIGAASASRVVLNHPARAAHASTAGAGRTARAAGARGTGVTRSHGGSATRGGGGTLHPGTTSTHPSTGTSGQQTPQCPASGCTQKPPPTSGPGTGPLHQASHTITTVVSTIKHLLPGSGSGSNLPGGSAAHQGTSAAGSTISTARHTVSGAASTAHHLLR